MLDGLVIDVDRRFLVQETVNGYIATHPSVWEDSAMIRSFGRGVGSDHGRLSEMEKNKISHRGRAARRMLTLIHTIEQEETFHVC